MRYLVSAAALAALNLAMWGLLLLPDRFSRQLNPQALAVFGILGSLLMLACLITAARSNEAGGPSPRREGVGVIAVAAVLLLFGVLLGKVEPIPGALVLICGSAALLIGLSAVGDLRDKRGLEITSHWGGFGGSTGGWRVSPAVTTILLALIFLAAAIGVAGLAGGGTDDRKGSNPGGTDVAANDVSDNVTANDVSDNVTANDASDDVAANDADSNLSAGDDGGNNGTAASNGAAGNAQAPAGIGTAPSSVVPDTPENP